MSPPQTAPVTPAPILVPTPAPKPRVTQPLPAPQVIVPSVSTPASLPASASSASIAQQPKGKNSFVDATRYSGQALASPPAAVVLTERATGCSTVVSNGQLQSGNCGSVAQPKLTPQPAPAATGGLPAAPAAIASRVSQQGISSSGVTPAAATVPPQYHRATVQLPDNGDTALLFPLSIPATVSSAFGWRVHPIAGTQRMHTGTDLAAPMGTPVLAAYSGEVAVADSLGGYGLTVVLRHEAGTQESRYAHLSKILVNLGDWVDQGTVIGLVGNTGYSTGPHLHFEWRHLTHSGWVAVDAGLHLEYAMEQMMRSLEEIAEADIK
ncbi:MAG: peptidoglycan DD-metalloendopeptidase family protein [Cyanophyceae cyanobacterium]